MTFQIGNFDVYLENARKTERYQEFLRLNNGDSEGADLACAVDMFVQFAHLALKHRQDGLLIAGQSMMRASLACIASWNVHALPRHVADCAVEAAEVMKQQQEMNAANHEHAVYSTLKDLESKGFDTSKMFIIGSNGKPIDVSDFMRSRTAN